MSSNEKLITLFGQTYNITQWARRYGLKPSTVIRRLNRGMTLKEALFATPMQPAKLKTQAGERTVKEVARALNVNVGAIYSRRRRGWKTEELAAKPMYRRTVTAFGKSQTVGEWMAETGLSRATIHNRLKKGWSPEEALSTSSFSAGRRRQVDSVTAFGQTKTLTEWGQERGINPWTIKSRLRAGMPVEVALTASVRKRRK